MTTPDLTTHWLGLPLGNPLVASSSPLTGNMDSLSQLEQAGVAAVVLPSLFQEQVEHDEMALGRLADLGAEGFPEASGFFPELQAYNTGPEGYFDLVGSARRALSIPVVASLNGITREGWAHHARRIEDAGAHALELNLLVIPWDPHVSSLDVEEQLYDEVAAVKQAVSIPVTAKIGTSITAPAHFVQRITSAGAEGVTLFNRFPEPDLDLEKMEVVPCLELSRSSEVREALRWIALLSPHVRCSLAASTGVNLAADAIKLLLAGADVFMSASALLKNGPSYARTLIEGVHDWMLEHEYSSVEQMKGSMNHAHCPTPAGYERLNYMRALVRYTDPTLD